MYNEKIDDVCKLNYYRSFAILIIVTAIIVFINSITIKYFNIPENFHKYFVILSSSIISLGILYFNEEIIN